MNNELRQVKWSDRGQCYYGVTKSGRNRPIYRRDVYLNPSLFANCGKRISFKKEYIVTITNPSHGEFCEVETIIHETFLIECKDGQATAKVSYKGDSCYGYLHTYPTRPLNWSWFHTEELRKEINFSVFGHNDESDRIVDMEKSYGDNSFMFVSTEKQAPSEKVSIPNL